MALLFLSKNSRNMISSQDKISFYLFEDFNNKSTDKNNNDGKHLQIVLDQVSMNDMIPKVKNFVDTDSLRDMLYAIPDIDDYLVYLTSDYLNDFMPSVSS